MIVGVAKEIKNNEFRVGMTPAGVEAMRRAGHTVLIEEGAGVGSGFTDADYKAVGAEIVSDKKALFDRSEMIVKVKEPLESEYDLFHEGQILFTYLHLAAEPGLTEALLKKKVVGIAYETVLGKSGRGLPLLAPMSEIAGRMSVQIGAQFLESRYGGSGVRSLSSAAATLERMRRRLPSVSVRASRSSISRSSASVSSTISLAAALLRSILRATISQSGCARQIS